MIPAPFTYLNGLAHPLMIVEAVKLYGTLEAPGSADNPTIMSWAKETGLNKAGYVHDEIPWCGLFMAVVAQRAGKLLSPSPLRALSWAEFGVASPEPSLGDVLVFKRVGGGHVTLYVGEDDANYYGLGGNQSDAVTIAPKAKSRLFACRRPLYHVQPTEVKPIRVSPTLAANPTSGKEV